MRLNKKPMGLVELCKLFKAAEFLQKELLVRWKDYFQMSIRCKWPSSLEELASVFEELMKSDLEEEVQRFVKEMLVEILMTCIRKAWIAWQEATKDIACPWLRSRH